MSDGPLPTSTCGVDSSPEAIAAMVAELGRAHRLVDLFPEKRPDGLANLRALRDLVPYAAALLAQVAARAAAAERQLAEARAFLKDSLYLGRLQTFEDRERFRVKARALLSGETTRVEDEP